MLQRAHLPSGDGAAAGLRVRIERIEPEPVVVGRGSVFYVEGSCFHLETPLRTLELLLGGRRHAVTAFPFARGDLAQEYGSRALESGFCAIVPVASGEATGDRALELRATLADGRVSVHDCGPVGFVAAAAAPPVLSPTPAGNGPLVAICMATYNPRPELFSRQMASIRAQTHARFVCLVADDGSPPEALDLIERMCAEDERFVLVRGEGRLGFYRNFERCLALVPPEASAVTLSDHDDEWHADKLATLVAALEGSGAQLVYSDMNIVDEDGALIAPSYWVRRRNNYTDLGSLLLANTVTGAASLFRRELLADILPFPPNVGHPYHDHWIACVALALGEIEYVDRPLYDYVQHDANVIGHYAPTSQDRSGLLHLLGRFAVNPRMRLMTTLAHSRAVYFADVVRVEMLARTLELRLGSRLQPERAAVVRRLAALSSAPGTLLWLLGRSAIDLRGESVTLGAENQLAKGILWRRAQHARARARPSGLRR